MEKPLVSIIVPAYNGEQYVERCYSCLEKQTFKEIEIIFVNDGSKDHTAQLCDQIAEKDDRVVVIHKKNGGLSSARNAGIQKASGEYVYFFDVDDEITENLVEDNLKLIIEHQADVVMFGFWYYDVDTNQKTRNKIRKQFVGNAEEFFQTMLIETVQTEIFNAPWNKIIRRDLLLRSGLLFDERYPIMEDINFNSLLVDCVEKIVVNPNPYYIYYLKSSGSLLTRFYMNFFDSVTQYHDNVGVYCGHHENSLEQLRVLEEVYVSHVCTYMKRVVNNKDLTIKERFELLRRMTGSQQLQEALEVAKLPKRKKLISFLIRHRQHMMIHCLYRFTYVYSH